jgi:hypothetical protein
LENFASRDKMLDCARNIFANLNPGGRYVGLWAPGAHSPRDAQAVFETVAMETNLTTHISSGDLVKVNYNAFGGEASFEWYFRTEDEIRDCLSSAGFEDIEFCRLMVNPAYKGGQDLNRFVRHVGNRHILAVKPVSCDQGA